MVYKKRAYIKKRASTSAWYDKKYSTKQLAIKALNATKYLKGIINSELLTSSLTDTGTLGSTPTIYSLNQLTQGDTATGRTGNSVFARNLKVKGTVWKHATPIIQQFRIIIFIDKQQVADTAPTAGELLLTSSGAGVCESFYSTVTAGRFRILKDKRFLMSAAGSEGYPFNFNFSLKHHIRFNGTASTDVQKGGVYLLIVSDDDGTPANYLFKTRISYYDN